MNLIAELMHEKCDAQICGCKSPIAKSNENKFTDFPPVLEII